MTTTPPTGILDDSPLSLHVLGGFQVAVGGLPVSLPANAQRVLGYLAVVRADPRRDVLAGRLWGSTSQTRAQANLRTALWRIRQVSTRLVAGRREVIGLGAEVAVDYRQATSQAQRLVDAPASGSEALSTRVLLLEADLLPGWEEDWLVLDRERHRQLRMHALEALSRRLAAAGEFARAVDAAYAALAVEPLYESAQSALIQAHLAEGNRAEALRQFTAFRRLLFDETGLAPSARLVATMGSAYDDAAVPAVPHPLRRDRQPAADREGQQVREHRV